MIVLYSCEIWWVCVRRKMTEIRWLVFGEHPKILESLLIHATVEDDDFHTDYAGI